jgi:dTMP kinase
MHLFASSRAQLLSEVTLKELSVPGTIVIYDRYIDSTLAYQGKGRKLGARAVLLTHQTFPLSLMPHRTLYLSIDLPTSHGRQKMRNAPKDYFESQGEDFYRALIEGYEEAIELFPDRIVRIDASYDQDQVFSQIQKAVDELLLQGPTREN